MQSLGAVKNHLLTRLRCNQLIGSFSVANITAIDDTLQGYDSLIHEYIIFISGFQQIGQLRNYLLDNLLFSLPTQSDLCEPSHSFHLDLTK